MRERKMTNDVHTVLIARNLDTETADRTLSELTRLIDGGSTTIVCDLSNTDYISSIGIGILLTAYKKLKKAGGDLVLSSLKPRVLSAIGTTGLLGIFTIRGDAAPQDKTGTEKQAI
jgi:anti-anti-sigma factor